MVEVMFRYDEKSNLWEIFVKGTRSPKESVQAFTAVVLSCQGLSPTIVGMSQVSVEKDGTHRILAAVSEDYIVKPGSADPESN